MRSRVVVVILLALATAPMAMAGSPEIVLPHHAIALDAQALRPAMSVSDLFAEVANPRFEKRPDGTISATAPMLDVMVARVDAEGNVVRACVHDEAAAVAFLESNKRAVPAAHQEK